MSCLKKLIIGSGILLPALLSALFVSPSYAVSDLVYDLSSSSTLPLTICNSSNSSPPFCSDYNYIIIEADNSFNGSAYDTLISGSGSFRVPVFGYAVIQIKDSFSSSGLWFNSINHSFRLTLTEDFSSGPSGSINITDNGTYDVSSYSLAIVDVPPELVQGDYHDDLLTINNSIIVCGAILLVLYFFYCIYRIIIKNSGVSNL